MKNFLMIVCKVRTFSIFVRLTSSNDQLLEQVHAILLYASPLQKETGM